jgi:hypothetical protein
MNFTSGEALSLKRDPIPGDDRSGWKETYHLDVMATDGTRTHWVRVEPNQTRTHVLKFYPHPHPHPHLGIHIVPYPHPPG